MYNAKILLDNGKEIKLGYEYGIAFDIDPINGVNIDLGTSQGFQQIGETVESQGVGGISRKITGVIMSDFAAKNLLNSIRLFDTGKLIFNERYFTEFYVKQTPEVVKKSGGKIVFSMLIFSPYPYWFSTVENAFVLGRYEPAFSFPVIYDTHQFGVRSDNVFVNAINNGTAKQPFKARFTSSLESSGYGVANALTGEMIRLNDTLGIGEVVDVYRKDGRLIVEKTTGSEKENIFYTLDEDSDLLWINVGDNILRPFADSGEVNLEVSVTFNDAFVGVFE